MTDENSFEDNISDENFWKQLGDKNFKKEKFDDAIKCYKMAIEINPNFSAAWNNLGYTYIKLGRFDEAKKCKDAIKLINEQSSGILNDNKIKSSFDIQQPNIIPVTKNTSTITQDTPYSPNILLICLFFNWNWKYFLKSLLRFDWFDNNDNYRDSQHLLCL